MASPNTATPYYAKDGTLFQHNAREVFDIDDVRNKCDNIIKVSEDGCENICKKIKNVEIGKETLCVADKSLEGIVEEVENYIKSITSEAIEPSVEQIYDEAVEAFNSLQNKYDDNARNEMNSYNNSIE